MFLRRETDDSQSFMCQMTRICSVKHSRKFALRSVGGAIPEVEGGQPDEPNLQAQLESGLG